MVGRIGERGCLDLCRRQRSCISQSSRSPSSTANDSTAPDSRSGWPPPDSRRDRSQSSGRARAGAVSASKGGRFPHWAQGVGDVRSARERLYESLYGGYESNNLRLAAYRRSDHQWTSGRSTGSRQSDRSPHPPTRRQSYRNRFPPEKWPSAGTRSCAPIISACTSFSARCGSKAFRRILGVGLRTVGWVEPKRNPALSG